MFFGNFSRGNLLKNSSPIVIKRRAAALPCNVKIISAGQESEIASWDKNSEYSLFTRFFVEDMSRAQTLKGMAIATVIYLIRNCRDILRTQ